MGRSEEEKALFLCNQRVNKMSRRQQRRQQAKQTVQRLQGLKDKKQLDPGARADAKRIVNALLNREANARPRDE